MLSATLHIFIAHHSCTGAASCSIRLRVAACTSSLCTDLSRYLLIPGPQKILLLLWQRRNSQALQLLALLAILLHPSYRCITQALE